MGGGMSVKSSALAIALCFSSIEAFAELSRVSLALNWKAEPQFGGFYEAKLSGEFEKLGLDVDILEGGAGTPTVQMAAAGKVHFAVVAGDELLVSRDRGSDLVAIFATYQTAPQGLMTHAHRDFKGVGDVFQSEGTLALQSGLPYAIFLSRKYDSPKVKMVPYAGGTGQFETDKKHSQQCFITSEPLSMEAKGVKTKTFLIADEGFNPYTTVVVVRKDYFVKNKKIVSNFAAALRKSWASYLKNPGPTNQKMAQINRAMDLKTFERSSEAQKPLIQTRDPLGSMSLERWETLATQLHSMKLIRKQLKEVKAVFLQPEELTLEKGK